MPNLSQGPASNPSTKIPTPPLSRKQVILIVDDDPAFRKMLIMMLREANFDFLEAENGKECLLKLSRHLDIDLVLVDIDMPQMNGIQLAGVIRNQEMYSKIPLIMVTAKSDQKSIVAAIKAGAQDYVVKPVNKENLIKKICQHLGLSDT